MKKSLVMATLVAASTSMMAMDLQTYLGAGAGVSWSHTKTDINGNISGITLSDSGSDSASSLLTKIQGGIIVDKTHRISLAYAPAFHSNATIHNIFLGYDYLIPVNNDSRVYLGTHLGTSSFKGKDDFDGINKTGFAYGAQLGYIYDITKNVEFEIGATYTKHNLDKTYSLSNGTDWLNLKVELDYSLATFAGINYKF